MVHEGNTVMNLLTIPSSTINSQVEQLGIRLKAKLQGMTRKEMLCGRLKENGQGNQDAILKIGMSSATKVHGLCGILYSKRI
jgi:hypothetical protein